MRSIIHLFSIICLVAIVSSCKPPIEEPIVVIVPDPEPTEHFIDQYYYAQFTWGRGTNNDTVTMQEPIDTSIVDDTTRFYQNSFELLSVPMKDTTEVDEDTDLEDLDTIGWVYAPSAAMHPFRLEEFNRGNSDRTEAQVTKDVFRISFPVREFNDTVPYWDIQDYIDNPSVRVGNINWGRIGEEMKADTFFMFYNDHRDGVMISYTDERGEVWESDNNPTFQPFGYFQIDSLYVNNRDQITYNIMVGQFAARLYNDVGYYKDMRAGKFRMKIFTDIPLGPKPK